MISPTESCPIHAPKAAQARCMLRSHPEKWVGKAPLDARDRALLDAEPVSFVDYSQGSFLRKIYHMRPRQQFKMTNWVVETEDKCKKLVQSAGAQLVGFGATHPQPVKAERWASMSVRVNINGTQGAGFDWGLMSGLPQNIRIFEGPRSTCLDHPWHAMIIRDSIGITESLTAIPEIASRKWDILLMKMCEDFDHPWVVVAMKDAGAYEPDPNNCGCQDSDECGCILMPPLQFQGGNAEGSNSQQSKSQRGLSKMCHG